MHFEGVPAEYEDDLGIIETWYAPPTRAPISR
jgi:hypothetical protein